MFEVSKIHEYIDTHLCLCSVALLSYIVNGASLANQHHFNMLKRSQRGQLISRELDTGDERMQLIDCSLFFEIQIYLTALFN